jgi:lipid A 3-O-deacylase
LRRDFFLVAVLASAGAAQAGDLSTEPKADLSTELKIGGLAHDVNPRSVNQEPSLFGNNVEEASLDVNFEVLFRPFRPLLGGTLRPAIGATVNTVGATSHAYIDVRWQYETVSGVFFAFGVGGAVHDGNVGPEDPDRKPLGSRVLFHIPVEVGFRFDEHNSASLYWEHMSHAGLADGENPGMDLIGIRYGYRF